MKLWQLKLELNSLKVDKPQAQTVRRSHSVGLDSNWTIGAQLAFKCASPKGKFGGQIWPQNAANPKSSKPESKR